MNCHLFIELVGFHGDGVTMWLTTNAVAGASFQLFLGGAKIFILFFSATGLLKNWKKQHVICSNLTLFIVPFFLFFLFSLFFFFYFFSFFFFFFLFPWGEGATPPQPPSNDAPAQLMPIE